MSKLDEELSARHLLNPLAIVAESEARLQQLSPEARAAFALLCAQRLMDAHLKLPKFEQRPFTLSWVPVLQLIWGGLEATESAAAKSSVQSYLNAFYEGPFNYSLGQDAPPDADDDTAACSIYAAEAFCRGDARSAKSAASRVIDATDALLQAEDASPRPLVEGLAHPIMQKEGSRLLSMLAMLESQQSSPTLIPTLRDVFCGETIQVSEVDQRGI